MILLHIAELSWGLGSLCYYVSLSLSSDVFYVVFLLFLLQKVFTWSQFFLRMNCLVCRCRFGVLMGGGISLIISGSFNYIRILLEALLSSEG